MGVYYNAVIAIGKEFDDRYDAQQFLEDHGVLSQQDLENIEKNSFSEWLYDSDKISGQCLDLYRGDYYYLGFDISVHNPEAFRKSFEDGIAKWNKLFPNDQPDVIKTVRIS